MSTPPGGPEQYGQQPPGSPDPYAKQPPGNPNPYAQQPPQQPYGYPQQPPQGQPVPGNPYAAPQQPPGVPQQAGPYGYPQQPPGAPNPYAQPQYGYPQQPPYGYPQQPPYGYPQQMPGELPREAYASWGARVAALLLDGLTVGLPASILGIVNLVQTLSSVAQQSQSCIDQGISPCTYHSVGNSAVTYLSWLFALGAFLFLAWKEGTTGSTPGRKIMGIKLIRETTGQPMGFGMAFGRRLLGFLDALPCYLGLLWPIWDGKKQTFSDKVIGSVVLRVK